MNKTAQNQYNSLMEAYYAVYDDDIRNKLNEEKEIKEFLEVIDFLIEDGYDLSEYTYEELYEYHITEGWGALLKGVGALAGKAGSAIVKGIKGPGKEAAKKSATAFFQGAKGPAKALATKAGKLAVPAAIAAGLDQYLSGGKVREYAGSAIQALRRAGHSIPSPGQAARQTQQAADSIKPYIAAPDISKPSPPKRNLPPAHLTQEYSYGKNYIITEDPAFPSQKPKGGDWSKLTVGGVTKLWDPETNSYQLPGTINKRLKSQGEKEITVPGKAPKPSPKPTPSTPAPEAPKPPASTPAPTSSTPAPKPPASTPAPTPSRPAPAKPLETRMSTVTGKREFVGTTAGGTKFERRAATSAELKAAREAREAAKTAGNTKGAEEAAVKAGVEASKPAPKPAVTSRPSGFGVPTAPLAAKLSAATSTAPPTPTADPKAAPLPPKKETAPPPPRTTLRQSYEYDAYDLVLEYLLSQGHAGTLEEANYVMLEMNAEMIGDIVEVMTTVQSVPIPIVPVKKGTKGGDGSNPPSHGEYKREYNPEVDERKLPPTKKK